MLSAVLTLGGCASWSSLDLRDDSRSHLDFLSRALTADAASRESMWRNALPANRSQEAQLRRALLQSVPGHSGYNTVAAEASLRGLLDDDPPADIAAVARLRLVEIKGEMECRQEVGQLKQRLSQVVNIERKLNQTGH